MHVPEAMQHESRHEAYTDFELSSITRTFKNPGLEKNFQRHHLAHTQAQLRKTLSFCAFFYVAFFVTDITALGYSRATLYLFLARLLVALTAIGGILMIAQRPRSAAETCLAATVVEFVGMGTFMLIVLLRPGEVPWHAMSMGIMLIVVYLFIPNSLVNSTLIAISSTIAFALLSQKIGTLTVSDTLTMDMLLILTNAFGFVAARRYQALWRQEFSAQSILKNLSIRDHLTGCYNRRHMQEHLLEREVERACRYRTWLTVIMCDLDHFKAVNDVHGHVIGDIVLRQFAVLLQNMCREHIDGVIRYGGEEFLLILPETDLVGGVGLAERLRRALAEHPIACNDALTVPITASFGVAAVDFSLEGHGVNSTTIVAAADNFLYQAKNAGRDCVKSIEVTREPLVLWQGQAQPA